jgi:UDP-N-acetylmuramoyl-tripeptide--D-alanyl-D-alanine ligase
MMRSYSLREVVDFVNKYPSASAISLEAYGDAEFSSVSTDSRQVTEGDLFVALKGERFDAHDFLAHVLEQKPAALVVERYYAEYAVPQLVVSDTTLALGQIARLNRHHFTGALIAITGSSGKTTVKTMIASILSEVGETHATAGNFNNHIGVPFTLLALDESHRYAVIEMGASGPEEIAYLCELASPQISMINNIMPAHIEGFGSIDGVAYTKGAIYRALPDNGIGIVNADDRYAPQFESWLNGKSCVRVSATDNAVDVFATDSCDTADGLGFRLHLHGESVHISLPTQGEHNVLNALMASACAYAAGASLTAIQHGLEKFKSVPGRMSAMVGIHHCELIDDTYNANPGSVRAAIDVLAKKAKGILVLGDLGELGENAEQLHAELGDYAKAANLPQLYTLGALTEHTARAFGERAYHFTDRAALIAHLQQIAKADMTILVKGSRSARMELVVRELMYSEGESH